MQAKKTYGFTMVELLVVVIILAVLSSIAMPMFNRSTDYAKLVSMDTTLISLRTAIDLYTDQHGHFPGAVPSVGTCGQDNENIETATPGAAAFIAHLTFYTTRSGIACTRSDGKDDGKIKYGPYLKTTSFPINPITGINEVVAIETGTLIMSGTGTDLDGGWQYDFITGKIIANQPSYDNR